MRFRKFGKLGWDVSEIGLGTWALGSNWGPQDDGESLRTLHAALDSGCNFIDTARAYGDGRSERVITRALKQWPGAGRVYVATKVPPLVNPDWLPTPYQSWEEKFPEEHIRSEIDKSLRDLNVDCIDLVQIHTWSRAWNKDPVPCQVLRELQRQGKLRSFGVSTPDLDQNSVIDLMRGRHVDSVQVIYNLFDQEAQAEIFTTALEHGIAVIVRVALDESSLTGKLTCGTSFAEGDIRSSYFAGDRLHRTVDRVERIRSAVGYEEPSLAAAALKFALKPPAVSTVIVGSRTVQQAKANCAVGCEPPMSDDLEHKLRSHNWRRSFWYAGK
jgi:aryl-alcohol dehydrogenase-like predicted oxidoreductase